MGVGDREAQTEADRRARRELSELRERWDEPIERATEITRKTLAWFPIRVWRHFLQHNGFLLAAAIGYQSLFAIFAALYFAFAIVGVWLRGSQRVIAALIDIINTYVPGLISDRGLVTPEDVAEIARSSSGVLAVTGAIAFLVAIWTAIGFVTFARRAVRDTFGLPFDRRNYIILKARDFLAAAAFGLALIFGAVLGGVAAGAIDLLFHLLGWSDLSVWVAVVGRAASIIVAFAINAAALAGLLRFLTGISLSWRRIWPGALLGGGALVVLQLGVGLLFLYTPSNPLLATFSVLIGFLLWFRLAGIVILVAASWVAVSANDHDVPLVHISEEERERAEHAALLLAAQVRVRDAHRARTAAPWWQVWRAGREVTRAEENLARVQASAPPPPKPRGLLLD